MAVTAFNYDPPTTLIPIQGVGTLAQSFSAIPQHALLFEGFENLVHDANQLQINATYVLPGGYVYMLTDFEVSLLAESSADLAKWDPIFALDVRYQNRSGAILTHIVPCNSWGVFTTGSTQGFGRAYAPERIPSYPIFPSSDPGVNQIAGSAISSAALAADCDFHTFARFLAFDQQQFENFPLHTPQISVR